MGNNKGADPKKKGGGLYNDEYMYDDGSLVCHNTDEVEVYLGEAEAPDTSRALGMTLGMMPLQPIVGSLTVGGPAEVAGFMVGDKIVSADNAQITSWEAWVNYVRARPAQPIGVVVERRGSFLSLKVEPDPSSSNSSNAVGTVGMGVVIPEIPPERLRLQGRNALEALVAAVERTYSLTLFTFESMWKMAQGLISTKNLSGPISIAQVAASTAESGFLTWLSFLALLSISLGAINLLPIPVLDGGHIVFHALEGLFGRPVPEQIQMMSYQLGLLAVFTLMVFAIYNDVARL